MMLYMYHFIHCACKARNNVDRLLPFSCVVTVHPGCYSTPWVYQGVHPVTENFNTFTILLSSSWTIFEKIAYSVGNLTHKFHDKMSSKNSPGYSRFTIKF